MLIANQLEREMLELVNAERRAQGLSDLQLEQRLNDSADAHSEWMLATNTFSHTGVGGSTPNQRMVAADFDFSGSWRSAENLGYQSVRDAAGYSDDVADVHTALMNSPGHRVNILKPEHDYIGIGIKIGIFNGLQVIMITQNFAATGGEVLLDTGLQAEPAAPVPIDNAMMHETDTDTDTGTREAVMIAGNGGDESLEGGTEADELLGGGGNDTLRGGEGDDSLKGQDGDDQIFGGAGDDRLPGENGDDQIFGGDGDDRLGGGDGDDRMEGGNGNDKGGGGNGNDTIFGGAGDDWFSGGAGNDHIDGGAGHDRLAGSYSHDTVLGGGGDDTIGGGDGHDLVEGDAGNDLIGAGNHNDTVYAGSGDDFVGGGDGNDLLYGDAGQDTINAGNGDDTLYGGAGSDTFVFNALSASGTAVIQDFEQGSDVLRLVGQRMGSNPLGRLDMSTGQFEGDRGTIVEFADHTIILVGLESDDLGLSDFLFV